jgi:hypothetical protein
MNDEELRALIRESIASRAGAADASGHAVTAATQSWHGHASHALFPLARGGDGDGACLIEPAVRCNHCGYCLSYSH